MCGGDVYVFASKKLMLYLCNIKFHSYLIPNLFFIPFYYLWELLALCYTSHCHGFCLLELPPCQILFLPRSYLSTRSYLYSGSSYFAYIFIMIIKMTRATICWVYTICQILSYIFYIFYLILTALLSGLYYLYYNSENWNLRKLKFR